MMDMTIAAIRTTMLRVPWPETPWLKGHAFGDARNLLVLEVETKGGIVGMGYLFSFRPGLRTVAAALEETILPRVIGKDATAVEAIWTDLWRATATYNRGGIVTMAMSALDIALWDAIGKRAGLPLHRLWGHYRSQIPAYGSGCFRGSGGDGMIAKALHYKSQGYKAIKMQVAHTDDLRERRRQCAAHARGARPRHRHHDRCQPGLDRRCRHRDGPQDRALRHLLAGGAGPGRRLQGLHARCAGAADRASSAARPISPASICGRSSRTRAFPSCSPIRCAAASPTCARPRCLPRPGASSIAPHLFPELNVQLLASIPNGVMDRGHGPVERSVRRPGAGGRWHDRRARARRSRACFQAGNPAGLPGLIQRRNASYRACRSEINVQGAFGGHYCHTTYNQLVYLASQCAPVWRA